MTELIEPFPSEDYPLLWRWLNEKPENNFDDSGPKDEADLTRHIAKKYAAGHRIIEVIANGLPCGVISYQQVSIDVGIFRGICFTHAVHGRGVALEAVRELLGALFTGHTKEVFAQYFSTNLRVRSFLKKLGARDRAAGIISCGKTRTEVSISSDDFYRMRGRSGYQGDPYRPGPVSRFA